MQIHPLQRRDDFSIDQPGTHKQNWLDLDKVFIMGGRDLNRFIADSKKCLKDFYLNKFDTFVRFSWLRQAWWYNGRRTILPIDANGMTYNITFVKFVRRILGVDPHIITRDKTFKQIVSYFDELFPDFLEYSPFENPEYYKFPFQNISTDFLLVVWDIDERLMLLHHADKEKMSMAKFMYFIANQFAIENEILGRDKYLVKPYNTFQEVPFYVLDLDKNKNGN